MQKQSFQQLPIFYRPYDFPSGMPVLAFFGDYWKVDPGEPPFLHFHNGIEIGYCMEGHCTLYRANEESSFIEKGDYCIIYPQVPHIIMSNDVARCWEFLYVDPKRFLEYGSEEGSQLWQIFFMPQRIPAFVRKDTSPDLYFLLSRIFREYHEKSSLYREASHGLLISLLASCNRITVSDGVSTDSASGAGYSCVRSALSWIYEHYMEPVSIRDLAARCCISESHFRRIFQEIIGISPLDYIQHYRIQQACHLIRQNQEPLNLIARRVGYTSLSSFNRQFRQYMNASPSDWKKTHPAGLGRHEVRSYDAPETRHVFQI